MTSQFHSVTILLFSILLLPLLFIHVVRTKGWLTTEVFDETSERRMKVFAIFLGKARIRIMNSFGRPLSFLFTITVPLAL